MAGTVLAGVWFARWVVARARWLGTVVHVVDRDAQAQLLPSPFVSSFVGRCRDGDLHDYDFARRSAAWARWAVSCLGVFRGLSDREYAALCLPGRFHDPVGSGPKVPPHLEIPQRVLDRPDPEFPDRLALAGNGLEFPWWLLSEVTAVKRALFNTPRGSVVPLVDLLSGSQAGLVRALEDLLEALVGRWSAIEGLLVTDPGALASVGTSDIEVEEMSAHLPAAGALGLRAVFDGQLRESNGKWVARRMGAWQLRGEFKGAAFGAGVVVPRLTHSSVFADPLFRPALDGLGAVLVRGVVLRRFAALLDTPGPGAVLADPTGEAVPGSYLRAVPARVGARLPEASVESAVAFLQAYPDAREAWAALGRWASAGNLLTVSEESFLSCHAASLAAVRRAETPDRGDINVVLPLAWDSQSRVVRVTFVKGGASE